MESREDLIKSHYMARIVELTSQLQLADSKSVHFYAEVSREVIRFGGFFLTPSEMRSQSGPLLFTRREKSLSEVGWSSY